MLIGTAATLSLTFNVPCCARSAYTCANNKGVTNFLRPLRRYHHPMPKPIAVTKVNTNSCATIKMAATSAQKLIESAFMFVRFRLTIISQATTCRKSVIRLIRGTRQFAEMGKVVKREHLRAVAVHAQTRNRTIADRRAPPTLPFARHVPCHHPDNHAAVRDQTDASLRMRAQNLDDRARDAPQHRMAQHLPRVRFKIAIQ